MKRVLCVLLLALIVPLLLIPASAAEEFLFERLPQDVMLFSSDYEFLYQDGFFVCPGQVPSGDYSVSFPAYPGLSFELSVSYSDMVPVSDAVSLPGCVIDWAIPSDDVAIPVSVLIVYSEEMDFTCLAVVPVNDNVNFDFSSFYSVLLTSVFPFLTEVVTSDSLHGVFNELVSLLPVVLVVLVAYIAVRKGFAWIQGFLHEV